MVGLRSGSIYEVNEATEEKKLLMASHHEGESWGLELVPEVGSLFSVGDDNKIMEYNYEEKKFIKKGTIASKPT